MHIERTTHEHSLTAKVYAYEGDYEVGAQAITWRATVHHAEEPQRALSGAIPITSPAGSALADKVVHDAIVKQIDTLGPTATSTADAAPLFAAVRTPLHDALQPFVGQWHAEGTWHRARLPDADSLPTAGRWRSTQSARWHGSRYFVVLDEHGSTDDEPVDTLTVIGVDAPSGLLFASCFDSWGLQRRYAVKVDRNRWTFDGECERATIEFSADGRTQHIAWQWRPRDRWLPLSQRTATRIA